MGISRECEFMIQYLRDGGIQFAYPTVGQINGGRHSVGSFHYEPGTGGKGLAIDFVGPNLRAIYDAFDKKYTHLFELILAGHGLTRNVKRGAHVPIYDHAANAYNHVHVAVNKGTLLEWNGGHPVANAADTFIGFAPWRDNTGYYTLYGDGGVFTHGNAPFYGSLGGKKLTDPIKGMASTPTGKGYWLYDTVGHVFCFGDAQFHGGQKSTK